MLVKIKYKKLFVLIVLFSLIISDKVFGDERFYVWTYEYKTMARGAAEVESYFTLSSPDMKYIKGKAISEHQIELEVGMTDHFDFSIYQMFSQKPESQLKYDGFKLRSRYRIGEKGKYFLDPLIYLEYKGKPDLSEHGIEFKLILAKDIKDLNIALNPYFEYKYKNKWEFEPKYALGISQKVAKFLRIGLEAKGSEGAHYIGPVISHGVEKLWFNLGSAFGVGKIEKGKPEFQVRLLIGVGI